MKFGEAVISGYRNAFVYSSRAARSEFWWFALFGVILGTLVTVGAIMFAFGSVGSNPTAAETYDAFINGMLIAAIICWILIGLPLVALGVRRMHDIGRGGVWMIAAATFQLSVSVGFFSGSEAASSSFILTVLSAGMNIMQLVIIVMAAMPGQPFTNRYGAFGETEITN